MFIWVMYNYQLMYADDTILLGDSKENVQMLLNECDKVCERRKLKVNVVQSKVILCGKIQRGEQLNLSLKEEVLEEVDVFKYLGMIVGKDRGVEVGVVNRVNEGAKVADAMSKVWRVISLGINEKRMMYESIVVPIVLYAAET